MKRTLCVRLAYEARMNLVGGSGSPAASGDLQLLLDPPEAEANQSRPRGIGGAAECAGEQGMASTEKPMLCPANPPGGG